VELAREGDRREGERRNDVASALEGEQHGRQQERDQPEEMPRGLADAVRHQAEHRTPDERRRAGDVERPEPPAREAAREDERQQHDEVVRPHVSECDSEWPVREPEEPALEARRRIRFRPEGVRVGERRGAALELVADEPEGPAELEVVACRGLPVTRGGTGEVVTVDVADRRPRRPERAEGVERARNEDESLTAGHEATTVPPLPLGLAPVGCARS
jgi:hypothetical protein